MRGKMIDWLTEINFSFKLLDETFFTTIELIDSFLMNSQKYYYHF